MTSLRLRAVRALLAVTPPVMLTFAIPFVNRDQPRVAGLPFLLFWITLWVLLAPLFLFTIYRLEGRHR
jgi:hypothetical protein